MASDDGASSCSFMLLQPELLSEERLVEILISRCVSMETIRGMSKEKLVDLYRRVALPLPQRDCYSGHDRKRKTTGKKIKEKIRISSPRDTEGSGFTIGFNGSIKTKISISGSRSPDTNSSNNRLKPPPEVQNGGKKIRLSSSKCDSLDNIVINNRRRSQETEQKTPPIDSVEKQSSDKNNKSSEKESCPESNKQVPPVIQNKKVTLKRNFNNQVTSVCKTEESPQEKKLKTKITWP